MNLQTFWSHHGIIENPFVAEEARHDPVFKRLDTTAAGHPDYDKILGDLQQPSTSVVFGEKGSGKTAIRLLIGRHIAHHNENNPGARVLLVDYDDLNPLLDRLHQHRGGDGEDALKHMRLVDHQDAILSRAVTRLVDALLAVGESSADPLPLPEDLPKRLRRMPRRLRVDLAVLAALYDQPRSGSVVHRFGQLWRTLRLGWRPSVAPLRALAILLTLIAGGLLIAMPFAQVEPAWLLSLGFGLALAAAGLAWGVWGFGHLRRWSTCRRLQREMHAIDRTTAELRQLLGRFARNDLQQQPLPLPGPSRDGGKPDNARDAATDARYQLTRRLLEVLESLDYRGLIVLVDRVDEPTLVSGRADRMRSVIWPMFDNKFLQQERVGVKLLLPIELRYMVSRESSEFFQEARLDKQNLIDRLSWSGATLYDLCTQRLRACRSAAGDETIYLTDLFEEEVSRDLLVDALDQMQQPRDAFKFLYAVIQEHCRMTPEDQPRHRVARLTLESVRRAQAQRVQELGRGLTPA